MDVSFVFLVAGAVILTGFLGTLFFEKTKVPDVLILLGIGILLGPVLGLVNPQNLTHFAEYIGAFALTVILLEGGLDMDVRKVIKEFGSAAALVLVSFIMSAISITLFLHLYHSWELMRSLLLGSIVGCTSAAIVIPVISRMTLKEEVKVMLSIESALSDVLAIVLTVSVIEFMKLETIGIQAPFRTLASAFSVALFAGLVSGLLWIKVLERFRERKFSYMTTLGAVLLVYAAVEFLGGSGPISILVFGIILGNCRDLVKLLKLRSCPLLDETIKFFHGEVTFFVRTFFFVYMGMMLSLQTVDMDLLSVCLPTFMIIVMLRYVSVRAITVIYREKRDDMLAMFSMLPRGLASAVLATLPMAANIKGTEPFVDYTFVVIVLTNLVMALGVFAVEKKAAPQIRAGTRG
jgi:cell volume regulation protein A